MSLIKNGWLRSKGEKFYAYTVPSAIYLEDGKTLTEELGGATMVDLINSMKNLQTKYDELTNMLVTLAENRMEFNTSNGIYGVKQSTLNTLISLGVLDPNVMYYVDSDDMMVCTRIEYLNRAGEVLTQSVTINTVGAVINESVYGEKVINGRVYIFPSTNPIIDKSTGAATKAYKGGVLYNTKNAILQVTASE